MGENQRAIEELEGVRDRGGEGAKAAAQASVLILNVNGEQKSIYEATDEELELARQQLGDD